MAKNLKLIFIGLGALLLIAIITVYFTYNPSQYSIFPKCPFYSFTNLYCPGCGSQRAIHQILNGNIVSGLNHNILIILLALVLSCDGTIIIINKVLNKKFKNILHKPVTTYSILILVIIFWVLRNIDLYPFSILAP